MKTLLDIEKQLKEIFHAIFYIQIIVHFIILLFILLLCLLYVYYVKIGLIRINVTRLL